MSRPHGAATMVKQPERITKAAASFQEARRALVSMLEGLSFVKVVSVQTTARGAVSMYYGEAVEVHFRDAKERPKLVFFDKPGRSRSQLKVGPMKVVQAPLGFEHASAVPTVGELLVGSLVPNARKSHLEHVLRGWSSDAKPLWELLRILKFGTKASEFEARSLLIQPAANLLQTPAHLKAARDDIYMAARVILWASVRPLQVLASVQDTTVTLLEPATDAELEAARSLRISSPALDFVDQLVLKLNDAGISEAFSAGINISLRPVLYDPEASTGGAPVPAYWGPPQAPVPAPVPHPVAYAPAYGSGEPQYAPTSPAYEPPPSPDYTQPSGEFAPGTYAPTSPKYAPTSPPIPAPAVGGAGGAAGTNSPPGTPDYHYDDY